VLSTEEPIRVFQQLATAAAIAPGRIEAVAGRGSSAITFPIFDLDERDYDMLFSSKLELLLALNAEEQVTWSGPHRRRPVVDTLVVPRPEQPLKIWLGTGGSPTSVYRADAEAAVPPTPSPSSTASSGEPAHRVRRSSRPGSSEVPESASVPVRTRLRVNSGMCWPGRCLTVRLR
jgi:alkanesulfonate monooxygenase SsuD/methylene tetrahydromethanopterin reductase-like flavin-dependent oxidoreductase (luciferase family)